MVKVVAQEVELNLTLDQILALVRQLQPQEREIIRRTLMPSWEQRLEGLLARVWTRVDESPLSEEDVDAEVTLARRTLYAQSCS
jgi:hypothetical protein